jgi:hypothetical protein
MQPRDLTWAALLGRWVEFAQSAVALPDDTEGRAWRDAVPAIIGLQALVMALHELDQLPADEQALGIDRARILIERHTHQLHNAFGDEPLHPMLVELIEDAWSAVHHCEAELPRCGEDIE